MKLCRPPEAGAVLCSNLQEEVWVSIDFSTKGGCYYSFYWLARGTTMDLCLIRSQFDLARLYFTFSENQHAGR